jgi:hypothetical protein
VWSSAPSGFFSKKKTAQKNVDDHVLILNTMSDPITFASFMDKKGSGFFVVRVNIDSCTANPD